ncbi:MAG: hypothetical protein ABIL22_00625 [candidate division WOR-3 bacterium]
MGFGIWNLGFTESIVFQSGDTLEFYKDDSLIYQWILKDSTNSETGVYYIEKAKVSPDNKKFFVFEEKRFPNEDSTFTRLTLYDAGKHKIWATQETNQRKISFELSRVYEDKIIIFTTDHSNIKPEMVIIRNGKKNPIDLDQWTSVVNYELSPNSRFLVFHTKKPYNHKLWDYIYFLDLQTNKSWEYLFPFCFSCKRGWLELKINDEGKTEVIYKNKNEHRIFDREGNLIGVFVKLD